MFKLLLLVLFFLTSCSLAPKKVSFGPIKPSLSESYAQARFAQIGDVSYDLSFDLTEKGKTYSGTSDITFVVKHLKTDLRLDFHEGTITSLKINGTPFVANYNSAYLILPRSGLKQGKNLVQLAYKHEYASDGAGFHRFQDPEDGRVYTYTNLEPYKANRVFPCFDQPDLKATYKMKVLAPKKWQVITSVMENRVQDQGQFKVWSFPESQKFSTYIWSLHAGEYTSWSWNKGKYPLRLFARKSMAKYIKVNDWFPVTDKGFVFFEKYFGVDYPYKKYDQIIVPEFNSGAMENVAAVTFTERFTSKGVKTRSKERALASVILHEMAHMWFGNLVTMKWWNDLWLNESFATYTAAIALARATQYSDEAWQDFNGTKNWAYWEDQQPTTHPIEADVPDTLQALANFDGITYGKGASSLKLLHYNIGDQAFQKGLKTYFNSFAEKNTTLGDFVAALEKTSGKSLTHWRKKWLQTSSLNTLAVNLSCKSGKLSSLEFEQSFDNNYPVLRPHSFEVALFNLKEGTPSLMSSHKVSFSEKTTSLSEAKGQPCPDIVFPNYGDYGYFKVKLNEDSVQSIVKVLPQVKSSFLRGMYLQNLWQMVRDGELNIYTFADVYKNNLSVEKNGLVFRQMLRLTSSLLYFLPKETQGQIKYHNDFISGLEKISWSKLTKAAKSSEAQKRWYQYFTDVASSPRALAQLKSLLDGRYKLSGFVLDQDKRWGIIYQLNRFDAPGAKALISKELLRDKSNGGKKMALSSQAVFPDWESKQRLLNKMTKKDSELSFDQFRGLTNSMFPLGQEKFREKYKDLFFEKLLFFEKEKQSQYSRAFSRLGPDECLFGPVGQRKSFLNKNAQLKPGTVKALRVQMKEAELCRKIKKLANEYSKKTLKL